MQTLLQNQAQQQANQDKEHESKPNTSDLLENTLSTTQTNPQKEEKSKFGFPQNNNYSVADYRSLVKTLVCGVKTITWGCTVVKVRHLR